MRYDADHNDTTRARIVEGASRLFRAQGIAGVGLAKVMAEAGLTVGTFYTHFASKEALVQAVLEHVQRARDVELAQAAATDLERVVRAYLSPAHRDAPATGCAVAALGAEIARHPPPTREVLIDGLGPSVDTVVRLLEACGGPRRRRADGFAFFGLLVGTLQLARATSDEAMSNDILEAGISAALELAGVATSVR